MLLLVVVVLEGRESVFLFESDPLELRLQSLGDVDDVVRVELEVREQLLSVAARQEVD